MGKSIKLSGQSLALAKAAQEEWRRLHDDVNAIEQKAVVDIKTRQETGNMAVKDLMRRICAAIGIPEEDGKRWGLDARFIEEHGDAYLIEVCPAHADEPDTAVLMNLEPPARPN